MKLTVCAAETLALANQRLATLPPVGTFSPLKLAELVLTIKVLGNGAVPAPVPMAIALV